MKSHWKGPTRNKNPESAFARLRILVVIAIDFKETDDVKPGSESGESKKL